MTIHRVAGRLEEDSGLTLLETLLAVMILGLAFAALMGALGSAVTLSEVHKTRAIAEDTLRNFAESVKDEGYKPRTSCPGTTWSPPGDLDPNAMVAVVGVDYWNGDSPATFSASCAGPDNGLEGVTLTATATLSGLETIESVRILLRRTGP